MRIGIITFHRSYNYGSVLQALALQTYLEQRGDSAQIIDFVYSKDFRQYRVFRWHLYLKHPKVFFRDMKRLFYNLRRKRNFVSFINSKLNLTSKHYNEKSDMTELNKIYDTFICGSDQIWNLNCTKGVVDQFFLGFSSEEKKRIAYGPSIAHLHFDTSDKAKISVLLNRFDSIAVREKSTIPFVQSYTRNKVGSVMDPTFLLDQSYYKNLEEKTSKIVPEYIFYYQLEDNKKMRVECERFAKRKGLKILYICKDNIFNKEDSINLYGCTPGRFLYLIHNACYVITNSFHATVFSIIYEKKFCTFTTQGSAMRMIDLLKELALECRLDIVNLERAIDYLEVKRKVEKLADESKHFLECALTAE